MRYELAHGRIQTWALEAHLVDHCNLRCAGCCPLSPHAPESFADPDGLARDLQLAATALAPRLLRLTGGEPTLHPKIVECLQAARASKVAPRIQVTTNGTKVAELPDAFFTNVDVLKLSLYPSAPLTQKAVERLEARCGEHGVELQARAFDRFQRVTPRELTQSPEQTQRAFHECWMKTRCHLVHRGHFYMCTRPPKLEPYLRRHGIANTLADDDGVALDGPRLAERILRMLEREEPMESCRHCLGNSGEWSQHRQLSREEIAAGRDD
ncbi:MAG: radical SAM protein [Deltaproteobacteria bacterium]|nr:radical SAM protein [Deltaproteobacteria bacterium]